MGQMDISSHDWSDPFYDMSEPQDITYVVNPIAMIDDAKSITFEDFSGNSEISTIILLPDLLRSGYNHRFL